MDGWPAMETDAGRAVMKTPATKAEELFKVVLPTPVATTLSISRVVDNHLATKYSKWSACPGRSLPVLYWYPSPISPTEPVSIVQLVRRSLGHSPRPDQAPTRIRTRAYNFFQNSKIFEKALKSGTYFNWYFNCISYFSIRSLFYFFQFWLYEIVNTFYELNLYQNRIGQNMTE